MAVHCLVIALNRGSGLVPTVVTIIRCLHLSISYWNSHPTSFLQLQKEDWLCNSCSMIQRFIGGLGWAFNVIAYSEKSQRFLEYQKAYMNQLTLQVRQAMDILVSKVNIHGHCS